MWSPSKDRSLLGLPKKLLGFISQRKWGAWTLVSLYISLLSGIAVGLQYDFHTPYYSVSSLDLLVPFGLFFRSLHFYSSQLFFLFCCLHLAISYQKSAGYSKLEWVRLTTVLFITLLLLFTGYVLRADNTGASAGIIAENIAHDIPLAGKFIDNLFFSITQTGLKKVYLHHVITLDLLVLMLAWNHLKTYRISIRDHLPSLSLILLLSLLLHAPLEPEEMGIRYISGPWFFLGLQEMLRYFSPLFAGVCFPLLFVVLCFQSQPKENAKTSRALLFLALLLVIYTCFSFLALFR